MSLHRLLADQASRLASLGNLLEEEQALLLVGRLDATALQRVADEKAALHGALENAERLRRGVQGRLGYAEGREGARRAAEDAGCLHRWESMLATARRVSRLNERNGRLLALRMTHNQRMLDELIRLAEPTVYAANGRAGLQPRRLNARA